ncbi:MAG: acyl-CoA dehydrogenase [Acidimicrobiales bacterium]|nr:acyl-CoA dehydrogenase [Acidimicrobiales bacterium]
MHLEETAEQVGLRKEIRAYFAELLTPAVRAELEGDPEGGPVFRRLVRKMGANGWLGVGWPKEYGGQGRAPTDQFIFFDEVWRARAPFPFVTINTVGPTIMLFGTEEQKQRFLPGILRGEINFAIGYTEPEAGTDLASLKTRAIRDGDEYVINGSKIFTSGADQADYVWLACRTDLDASKHKGISIILVPTSSPGFSATLIHTVGDTKTAASYYVDVRVPVENIVAGENEGWRLITNQLNHERVGLAALGGETSELYDAVERWVRDNALIELPWVQRNLAEAYARLEAMRLLNWQMARKVDDGSLRPQDASSVKVYGTETHIQVYRLLLDVVGPVGYLAPGSPGAILSGRLERASRSAQINTFGGGVNEVQREIVAWAGLKMARQGR